MRGFLPAAGDAAAGGEERLYPLEELGLQQRRARPLDLVGAMHVGHDIEAPGMRVGDRLAADLGAAEPAPTASPTTRRAAPRRRRYG